MFSHLAWTVLNKEVCHPILLPFMHLVFTTNAAVGRYIVPETRVSSFSKAGSRKSKAAEMLLLFVSECRHLEPHSLLIRTQAWGRDGSCCCKHAQVTVDSPCRPPAQVAHAGVQAARAGRPCRSPVQDAHAGRRWWRRRTDMMERQAVGGVLPAHTLAS